MKIFKSKFVLVFTILFSSLYFLLPTIAEWIVSDPTYAKYAGKDVERIVYYLQKSLVYPFGKFLNSIQRYWFVIPYYFIIFLSLRYLFKRFRKFWKISGAAATVTILFLFIFPNAMMIFENNQPSITHGTVANGSIENAKRMYFRGTNFKTYSFTCYLLGRTFTHNRVRQTILEAYQTCEKTCPNIDFILGEIGHRNGGAFLPHRTHRNGMSVDFMTPLLKHDKPYHSSHLFNLWGYRHEFDNKGENGSIEIDYQATARHISALVDAAKKNNLRIQKIIFDPVLRPYLLATPEGKKLKNLPWTKNRVIVRHDDHYHIDFVEK